MGSQNKPGRDTIYESLVKKVSNVTGKLPSYDQIEFTEEERLRFEKLSFIDDLVRRKMPILKLADIYKLFSLKYNDSQRHFYRLYEDCQQLFGSTGIKSKNYQISIYVTWLEQAASIAFKQHDIKAATNAIAEAAKLLNLYTPEDTDKKQNEIPRNFIVALNINLPDGAKESMFINLDELNKLKPSEFSHYLDEVNSIEYPMDKMEADIIKSKADE